MSILTSVFIYAIIEIDIILFGEGKMNLQMHRTVLEILAQHKGKFMMTPDIISEVLKTREARHVVHELKKRGHIYGVKTGVSDEEMNNFINNSYRHEVVSALSMLKPKGCIVDTYSGKSDSFQKEILNLGTKVQKGELAYQITELGLQRLANIM